MKTELTYNERQERERVLGRIHEAAEVLKKSFGALKVVLFGSLAHAAWFMPDSDVDLAVEGLDANDYWQAWRTVEEIIGDRTVDLIEIETAGNSLLEAIKRHGVEF